MQRNVREYDLELSKYNTGFVEGLRQHIAKGGADQCYAFVLGTRQGDPNCGAQTSFTPSRYALSFWTMRVRVNARHLLFSAGVATFRSSHFCVQLSSCAPAAAAHRRILLSAVYCWTVELSAKGGNSN